ncbi:MAG: DUF1552 domain-containing protein [Bacteroidota bacterium]
MKKSWHISRRRMLKGLGACVALPVLDAMIPAGLSAKTFWEWERVKRIAFMFMPNGVHPDKWTPEGQGTDFHLSPILQPLTPFKNDLLVLGELMNQNSWRTKDGHYTKTANFLTSMRLTNTAGANVNAGGVSVDQIIANQIGDQTLFPSLQYGVDRVRSGVDLAVNLTRLYGSAISWKSPTQPIAKEINPRMAFDRLFRPFVPGKPPIKENPHKKSVLDLVMQDAKSLQKGMGVGDQNKLAEYLDAVRSVERRLDNQDSLKDFEAQITPDVKKELVRLDQRIDEYVDQTAGIDITERVRLMFDIMALAFWSDATRVTTFMFGNSVSSRNFSFLDGVSGSHHGVSHHKNDPRLMSQYEIITRWHIEQYGYFLSRLASIKEGDHSLLDNSMVMFGSGLRDGNRHSPHNLPIVVAGKGGGTLATGQHLTFAEDTPLANLYLTMLHGMDVSTERFADSERVLHEIVC